MAEISDDFTWTTSDTVLTVEYFNQPTDEYLDLALSYMLYDNPTDWTTFDDYVVADVDVTTNEESNVTAYQSYSLRIICDLTTFTTENDSGCCL